MNFWFNRSNSLVFKNTTKVEFGLKFNEINLENLKNVKASLATTTK